MHQIMIDGWTKFAAAPALFKRRVVVFFPTRRTIPVSFIHFRLRLLAELTRAEAVLVESGTKALPVSGLDLILLTRLAFFRPFGDEHRAFLALRKLNPSTASVALVPVIFIETSAFRALPAFINGVVPEAFFTGKQPVVVS